MFSKTTTLFPLNRPDPKKPVRHFTFLSRAKAMAQLNILVQAELPNGKELTSLIPERQRQLALLHNLNKCLLHDPLSDYDVKLVAHIDLNRMTSPSLSKVPYHLFEKKLEEVDKAKLLAKQRAMPDDAKMKLLIEEKNAIREKIKDMLFAAMAIYVYMDIYSEYKILDPNNSKVFAGLPAVLGITAENRLDYRSAKKALLCLQHYITLAEELPYDHDETPPSNLVAYNKVLDITRVDSNISQALVPTADMFIQQIAKYKNMLDEIGAFPKAQLKPVTLVEKKPTCEKRDDWKREPNHMPWIMDLQAKVIAQLKIANGKDQLRKINKDTIHNGQFDLSKLDRTIKPSTKQKKPHLFSTYQFSEANEMESLCDGAELKKDFSKLKKPLAEKPIPPKRFFDSHAWKVSKKPLNVSQLEKRSRVLKKTEDIFKSLIRLRGN